jgi:hypothetical protein
MQGAPHLWRDSQVAPRHLIWSTNKRGLSAHSPEFPRGWCNALTLDLSSNDDRRERRDSAAPLWSGSID